MLKIGITGGIGSGKSVVSKIIESLGYPVFNSDIEAKRIANFNVDVRAELIALCGEEVYSNGQLNREVLANQIFSDDSIRDRVNEIIHPRVREAYEALCRESNSPLVFNEAAILIETGASKKFDKMILVTAPESLRIERVINRDQTSLIEVKSRIDKQWTDDKKKEHSDFVIQNDGEQPLLSQVEECINQLISS